MYNTPKLTKLASSIDAIQSLNIKVQDSVLDIEIRIATIFAYEADE